MNINLIVSGELSGQSGYSAMQFAKQAIEAGHSIAQVFFYQGGVGQANSLAEPPAGEFNCVDQWAALAADHALPLIICVSAAERRGVISSAQQHELAKKNYNLHPSFTVEGLGAMHDATLNADRTVTFK